MREPKRCNLCESFVWKRFRESESYTIVALKTITTLPLLKQTHNNGFENKE